MKKLLTYSLFVLLLILTACSNEIPEHHQPVRVKRTVLAYLAANNNLNSDIMRNMQWMYESLCNIKDTCTLLIYYKYPGKETDNSEILEFQTNGLGDINNQPALKKEDITFAQIMSQAIHHQAVKGNSVSPQVMKENLKVMQGLVPSESYGLIFGSHANGWFPASKEEREIHPFAFGDDKGYGIDIPDLKEVLKESFPQKNLDFILFDACMMGIAEIGYAFRDVTHYCIASVMETPAVGFPYQYLLDELYQDEIDYSVICKKTVSFNRDNSLWGTYAVIDCTKMDSLAAVVRNALQVYREQLAGVTPHSIQQYGVNRYTYFAFDINDLFRILNNQQEYIPLRKVLDEVIVAKDCIDDSNIPIFGEVLTDRNRFCGIGMYIPYIIENQSWDNYYEKLEWYRAVGWEELKDILIKEY